jgi:DNA-binding NarL/FixJ family response regulator
LERYCRTARHLGRSQSDLIREGIRRVILGGAAPSLPPDDADDAPRTATHMEWLTRPEEIAISLRNAGKTTTEIARELGLPVAAARHVLNSLDRKLRSSG